MDLCIVIALAAAVGILVDVAIAWWRWRQWHRLRNLGRITGPPLVTIRIRKDRS